MKNDSLYDELRSEISEDLKALEHLEGDEGDVLMTSLADKLFAASAIHNWELLDMIEEANDLNAKLWELHDMLETAKHPVENRVYYYLKSRLIIMELLGYRILN